MLHAEEGLWLAEKGLLAVHPQTSSPPPKKNFSPTAASAATASPSPATSATATEQQRSGKQGDHGGAAAHMGEAALPTAASDAAAAAAAAAVRPPASESQRKTFPSPEAMPATPSVARCGSGGDRDAPTPAKNPAKPLWSDAASEEPDSAPTHADRVLPPSAAVPAGVSSASSGGMVAPGGEPSHGEEGLGARGRKDERGSCCRGGGKRRRPAGSGTPFLSIDALQEALPQARVPWECYRAYAELKRRCDVFCFVFVRVEGGGGGGLFVLYSLHI